MNDDTVLEETGRGLTVRWRGRYLYSRRDPSSRPVKIAETVPQEHRCLYIVPSPLLGYGIGHLAASIPEDSHILALEIDQGLMAACSSALDPELTSLQNTTWVRLSDRASLHEVLRRLGPWKFRRVRRVDLSAGASVDEDGYTDLTEFLTQDLATYWRNRHALGRLGRQWVRHLYTNLAAWEAQDPAATAPQDETSVSATVVTGAGPTLDRYFPFMRENRHRIRILTADTALPALIEAGIMPDAVVALETQAWNFLDFHGSASTGIPVYADMTAYPASLVHMKGGIRPYSSDFADLEWLMRLEQAELRGMRIPPLGSVGLAAVEIAMETGVGPVMLAGLDFAYEPGKSHARGCSVHRWQMANRTRTDPIPGYAASMRRPRLLAEAAHGGLLRTDAVLKGYASLLIDRYAHTERLYVLSPGGLDLGVPVLHEEEASALLDRTGFPTEPHRALPTPPEASSCRRFLDEEVKRLEEIVRAWDLYAAGSVDGGFVAKALDGMDQVFCDFPDEPPLPNDNNAFLVRAVNRTRSLLRLLNRVRKASL